MNDSRQYAGTCFCGAVEILATGAPFTMGYCHCEDCRSWSAGPVNAYTLWKTGEVTITKGIEDLGSFSKNGSTHRKFCTQCGGNVLAEMPELAMVDVFASMLPTLAFEPVAHVNYESTVLRIKDGLPKFKDFPAESGGSGEMLAE